MMVPVRKGHLDSDMYSKISCGADLSLYDQRSWDQSINPAQRPPLPIPSYNHEKFFVAFIYNEKSGEVVRESSPNLTHFKPSAFQEISAILRNHIQNRESQDLPGKFASAQQSKSGAHDDERHDAMILDDSAKRSRSETIPPETIKQDKPRPQKTRRIKSKSAVFPEDSIMPNASFSSQVEQEDIKTEKRVTHMLASRSEWEKWFRDAFAAIQQLGCRTMAKEWIKIIHPKKQSTHPYNGKKVKAGIGNPESTKPPYWPKDVPHKEPDHINKEDRMKLLLSLLMGTPHKELSPPGAPQPEKEIDADAFMAALEGKYENKKHGLQGRRELVQDIIRARKMIESYEDGGMNGDTTYSVVDYANTRRGHSNDEDGSKDATDDTLEVITQYEDGNDDDTMVLTPTSMRESPVVTEMPVLSEALVRRSKRTGIRKTKRRSKMQEAYHHNVSLTGRTLSRSLLPPAFDIDQPAPHQHSGNQTPVCSAMMWPAMHASSGPPAQFHYPYAEHPDPRSNHMQNQYPGEEYSLMPIGQPHFANLPHCYPQSSILNMPYSGDPHSDNDFHTAYAYFGP